ncbi:hypothetical protein ANCCAN_14980 [Ancylostoma caninum]|uniref:CWH43-like N-terminal domain-containing protein n=1 Tax=Ancylostoma caninum TaxID=29170 RepID=A0A368G5X9_ANCCA|nr:hypothetical protein ANCCAN_14980 [Ancylostoma caninum]
MVLRHVWLAPVMAVGCMLIGIFSGYIIGAAKGHFPAILPFISDGGSFYPGASVFAQFLNMASFFFIILFYMRHRQAVEYYGHRLNWEETGWRKVSLALMWVGIVSTVGITIVANFRDAELAAMHAIGALVTFLATMIYAWGQVILGYSLVPRMAPMPVNHLRLILVILATCFLVLHELANAFHVFVPKSAGDPPHGWQHDKWMPSDSPFYRNYIIATSSEWAMTLTTQLFFLSFIAELRFAYAHAPRVIFKRSADDTAGMSECLAEHRNVRVVELPPVRQIASDW